MLKTKLQLHHQEDEMRFQNQNITRQKMKRKETKCEGEERKCEDGVQNAIRNMEETKKRQSVVK